MGEWKKTILGDAFLVNPPRSIKRGSVVPFIPMEALPVHARAVERVDYREFTGSGTRFQNGDTLIARITPCLENGKTAYLSELPDGSTGHGSTEYIVLSGKDSVSDSLFGYYIARSTEFRKYAIGHMEGTSGRQRVPTSAIQKFPIHLPSLPEQRAIAHILGSLDDKIELNRKRNETLEAMARALFQDWFVDFGPVRAKMEGREPYLPSEIWELFPERLDEDGKPEGWVVVPLKALASLETSSISPGKSPEAVFEHYSIPAFDAGRMPFMELGDSIKSNKYKVHAIAVLVSKLNPQTPRVWLPMVATDHAVCSTEFMQFVPRRPDDRPFLYCLMVSEIMEEEVLKHVTGSTGSRQRAQPSQIAKVEVLLPESDILSAFNRQTAPLLRAIADNQRESQTLAHLRDTLLPKLISGELTTFKIFEG